MSTIETPDEVAFETPAENAHIGTVVDTIPHADLDDGPGVLLVVEYEGHHYRVDADDTIPV